MATPTAPRCRQGRTDVEIDDQLPLDIPSDELIERVATLQEVKPCRDLVQHHLSPNTFFANMIDTVPDSCPITFHAEARHRGAAGAALTNSATASRASQRRCVENERFG